MSDLNKTIRATDIELKDRLVAINRVTKVTKGHRKSLVFFISKHFGKNKRYS